MAIERPCHPWILGAAAGEEENHARRFLDKCVRGCRVAIGRAQYRDSLCPIASGDDAPVREVRSTVESVDATSGSAASILESRKSASRRPPSSSAFRLLAESTSSCGLSRSASAAACWRVGACSITACALVPPTPSELTPARRGPLVAGQGVRRSQTRNGTRREINGGVWLLITERGRDLAVLERQRRLDQTDNTGSSIEMSDVRFH